MRAQAEVLADPERQVRIGLAINLESIGVWKDPLVPVRGRIPQSDSISLVDPLAVQVEVTCVDSPGLLAAMSKAISASGINITRAQVRTVLDHQALNTFELMVDRIEALNRVVRALGKVKGVLKVRRVRT